MTENASLTPEEVAEILKIRKNTVYEMIKRGDLPAYRVGRKLRVDLKDVNDYKNRGKQGSAAEVENPLRPLPTATYPMAQPEQEIRGAHCYGDSNNNAQNFIICGQDVVLDLLSRYLELYSPGVQSLRYHAGSMDGLLALYRGRVHLATAHLWDGDTGIYNVPYVRRLVPGVRTIVIRFVSRMAGFYVPSGNPKGIQGWNDLARAGITMVNRERGCGARVLLDEQLRRLNIDSRMIQGYEQEELSHMAVAGAVSAGRADVGLGIEKVTTLFQNLDFIPLQREHYDLIIRKNDANDVRFRALMDVLRSKDFRDRLSTMGGYSIEQMGEIVEEL
ncbi:helix-turn-helix domain-containing protein [Heliobacillus mobilis]|uniref:Helix-turn-helix domain-containing protein n=1 Tax=Heliobacterium mobile TaxID=28064 RepID=A0A6I3SJW3_HELMO|nr:helix-turn-helix transcriptional regulator [Heliobacterium mobile]MTV49204.1 helix-turn-helix domain-containing protein [Heliobacterium mobile]